MNLKNLFPRGQAFLTRGALSRPQGKKATFYMTSKKGWARAILAYKVSFMCFENKSSISSQAKRFIEDNIELIEIGDHDRLIRKAIVDLSSKHFGEVKGILGCKNIDCGFLDSIQRFYTSNRINKIKCYNVGFGDCFLCKDENTNSKMLIDCGTTGSFKSKDVIDDIYSELVNAAEKNLMISLV